MVSPALGATVRELRGGRPRLVDSALRRLPEHFDPRDRARHERPGGGPSLQAGRFASVASIDWRRRVASQCLGSPGAGIRGSSETPHTAPDIGETEVDEFLDYLFAASNLIPSVLRRRPSLRDPDDEHILELAVQCGAMIITHNIRDFVGAERFGVAVRTPGEFLKLLGEGQ
jgi:hypothetical protein